MPDFFDRLADELVRTASPATSSTPRRWMRHSPVAHGASLVPRWPRSELGLASVLLAAVAIAAVAIVAVSAQPRKSPSSKPDPSSNARQRPVIKTMPVSFRTTSRGDIVATVTDPFAAQSALNAAFAAAGLNITVNLMPVSPSLVGTVVGISGPVNATGRDIQVIEHGTCIIPANGCPVGVIVPRNYTGRGSIALGRPALPGELYGTVNSAFAPGEYLHCSGLLNEHVASALPRISAENVTARWWHNSDPGHAYTNDTPPSGSDYIIGAVPVSAGTVLFQTRATPLSASEVLRYQFNRGC